MMTKNSFSKISNAFSTGGGGVNFEQQIQAMFLLSLLIDGFCPAMNEQTKRVCFQAKRLGYDIDDLAVFTYRNQDEGKLLCQIKHSITATKNNKVFQEVICAAWNDFNKKDFDKERDQIALVTAQISMKAQQSLHFLHAKARGSVDEAAFWEEISTPVFSNTDNVEMLAIIENCITIATDRKPTHRKLWEFCRVFILLLFDMDCRESVNRTLTASLIKCNSSTNALLVWSRLVEYAGECNQTAASIEQENIDKDIQAFFVGKKVIQIPPTPITKIDLFIPTVALIGAWQEDNEYDRQIIEKISGIDYSEFEAKARNMLIQNSEYLRLTNGNWRVVHKEELLDQCKNLLFDDLFERLLEAVKSVLNQNSGCAMDQTLYYVTDSNQYNNSRALRRSLVKSLCWGRKVLPELSKCNHNKIEGACFQFVNNLLKDAEWATWVKLRDCLQDLAELAPDAFLDRVESGIIYKAPEMLKLFPKSGIGNNYISELLWSLEILAWSPDYLVRSIGILGMLEALPYEQTNWANTPINSMVSILLPWHPQTAADFEKRETALRCLKNDNLEVFWSVLKKLLPGHTTTTTENPKPHYLLLLDSEKITVTNKALYEEYACLLELAVESAENEVGKLAELADQIKYMYEPALIKYLNVIENSIESNSEEQLCVLWINLCKQVAMIKPSAEMVIYKQWKKIQYLVKKLEPKDLRLKYQELYLGNRWLIKNDDYVAASRILENRKSAAIKEIFDQFGVEETERFAVSVKNIYGVASKLGHVLTTDNLSLVIKAYSAKRVSKEFAVYCISTFVGVYGAEKLLETSLQYEKNVFILEALTQIPFSMELLKVVKQMLPDDSKYWKEATMPYGYQDDDVKNLNLILDKLIESKRYVTALNIIGHSEFESVIDAERIYRILMLTGTEESIGSEVIDNYAAQKVIGWFQQQKCIDLKVRSDIDFIYLPVFESCSEIQPHALTTRLSLNPDYFCKLLELSFKKNTEDEKQKVELSSGLCDRLYEVLFHYSVVPGLDWNGNFDELRFLSWMSYVKKWSKKNNRYEVAMHTVGSGLSYTKLDEEKLPSMVIIKELNKAENKELRRGYYLGIINQRGVHFIDPEGKPEFKMAEEYNNRANIAEKKGYWRYADVLRLVADEYNREAKRNILMARNRNEE